MWAPSSFLFTCTTTDLREDEYKNIPLEIINTNWACSIFKSYVLIKKFEKTLLGACCNIDASKKISFTIKMQMKDIEFSNWRIYIFH